MHRIRPLIVCLAFIALSATRLGAEGPQPSLVPWPKQIKVEHAIAWDGDARLVIKNYDGRRNRVAFGATRDGLSTLQLAQIRFEDPAGHPPCLYGAAIGEQGQLTPGAIDPKK